MQVTGLQVLSACNTAAGDKGDAEALSALARAFFYAKARALLVSHWHVNSEAAVKLTTTMGLRRQYAMEQVWALRNPKGLPIPKEFESAVQSAFNRHNGQSDTFVLGPEDDVFYPVGGKGSGKWAVHRETADAWLAKRGWPR